MSGDLMPLPPERRAFRSPDQRFEFVVDTEDAWATPGATGSLFEITSGQRVRRWQMPLPQEYGPRTALVGPDGQVLMLDEWINVKSHCAVMLVDAAGRIRSLHSFDDVVAVLRASPAAIVRSATSGWWIAGPVTLAPDGWSARVPAGGAVLAIDLENGDLCVAATQ